MRTVCRIDQCAGCMVCVDICPKEAIKVVDSMMAYNGVIDENKCINCGACHKVCQENTPPLQLKPIVWKEGWSNNVSIREKSSSGGIATAIEKAFVQNEGTVCSCYFNNGEFLFSFANTETEIQKFTGSKYVKSNPKRIYQKILHKLREGEKVLFVGLPCQVAALKNIVRNNDNLYTIDLICHGTPSPKVLDSFLHDYETGITKVKDIKFRKKNSFFLEINKKRFTVPTVVDNYIRAFLDSVTYTENCYNCKYATLNRVGDITLGDSWGSELPEEDQDLGVSLILCQTDNGKKLLESADVFLKEVDLERAVKYNHQLSHPSVKPKQRDQFMKGLSSGNSFKYSYYLSNPKRGLKNIIKALLYRLKS